MKTLKTSRRMHGPIGVRGLCRLEDRKLPYSVLDVVTTDEVRLFSGRVSSGDVDCTWQMKVAQNGFWWIHCDFHDGGFVAGDFFTVEFVLDSEHGVGAGIKGSILDPWDNRHLTVSSDGSDAWIRDNWFRFEGSGPDVTLRASPAVGMVFEKVFLTLLIVVAVAVVSSGGPANYETRKCADDPYRDPNSVCVEFHRRADSGGGGVVPEG